MPGEDEPLVVRVDASELEVGEQRLDSFADASERAEAGAESFSKAFDRSADVIRKQAEAAAAASDGYGQLTEMQRAYVEGNEAAIRAYEAEYKLSLDRLNAEAAGYDKLTDSQRAYLQAANESQAQAEAESRVTEALARARESLAKASEQAAAASETQTAAAQSAVQANAQLTASMERTGESAERNRAAFDSWQRSSSLVDAELKKQAADTTLLSNEVQELVQKYDPLGTKLKQLQGDFAALDRVLKAGGGTGQEAVLDRAMGNLNAQITRTKGLLGEAGDAGSAGFKKIADGSDRAVHGVAGVTRELIVIGHEAMSGNFSRIPGSMLVLTSRLGGLGAILGALLNPFTLLALAIGAVVAIVAKGASELDKFNESVQATGNFAGVTAASVDEMAQRISQSTTFSVGKAKALAEQVVATGRYSAENVEKLTALTDNFAHATGQSADEALKHLIKLFEDPLKGAQELDQQYHFLSIAQLDQIRNLQDQGREQEAVTVAISALNDRLPSHVNNVGLLAKAWNSVAGGVSSAIDWLKRLGTQQFNLDILDRQLASLRQRGVSESDPAFQRLKAQADAIRDVLRTEQERAKAEHDVTEEQEAQKRNWAVIQKFSDDVRRSQLEGQLKQAQEFSAGKPEEAEKQLAAIQKIKKELAELGVDKGLQSEIKRALDEATKDATAAEVALANVGATTDQRVTPAMRKLAQLMDSDVWKKLPANIQQQIIALRQYEDGLAKTTAVQEAALAARKAYEASGEKTVEKLQAETAQLEHQIRALEDYDEAQKGAAESATEFQLANDKTRAALLAMAQVLAFGDDSAQQLSGAIFALVDKLDKEALSAAKAKDATAAYKQSLEDQRHAVEASVKASAQETQVLEDQLRKLQEQNFVLVNGTQALEDRRVAELQYQLALVEVTLGTEKATAADEARAVNLRRQIDLIHQIGDQQRLNKDLEGWKDFFGKAADYGAEFITSFFDKSHRSFSEIWQDFLRQALAAFAKILAQKLIVNIATAISPTLGGVAQQAFGLDNNPLSSVLNFGSNPGLSFATSAAGQVLGLSSVAPASTAALELGAGAATEVGSAAAGAGGLALTGAGSALASVGTFIPYVAAAFAAASALGLFDKKPSPVRGQFQVSTGTSGFEDNAFTASPFGNLGFSDANTQQFSGQAAQVFNKIVEGALDAFKSRYSPEQTAKLADILQHTTFATQEGTFTTEEFLQKYGGSVLKQVVTAAFEILDPALASVVAGFTGTADEVAKFSNTLLAVYDATKAINNADFTANVEAALQGADQATADKVLAFVTIVQQFGDSISGLGDKLEGLDPENITKFVDALGGAQAALDAFGFLNANFTTSTNRAAQAQAQLDKAWDAAGVTVDDLAKAGLTTFPQTHQQFLDLINSLDLNTEHGRTLAATLLNQVAPAFVGVKGSAEAAAAALRDAQAALDTARGRGTEGLNRQYSTDAFNALNATVPQTGGTIREFIHNLGFDELPRSVAEWGRLNDVLLQNGEAGKFVHDQLILLFPEWQTLDNAIRQTTDSLRQASDQFHHSDLFSASEQRAFDVSRDLQAFADAEAQIGHSIPHTVQGFKEYVLNLEEVAAGTGDAADAARAELAILYPLTAAVLDYNNALKQQTDTITVSVGDLINAGMDAADKFIQGIQGVINQSTGDFGSKLEMELDLIIGAAKSIGAVQLPARPPTTGLGGIQIPGSPGGFVIPGGGTLEQEGYLSAINTEFQKVTDHLARFTVLSAQYGSDIAEQLVALQDWKTEQQKLLAGNAAALAVVDTVFQQRWDAIIHGSTAAAQSLDDFIKSVQQIASGVGGNAGQTAALQMALIKPRLDALKTQLAGLDPTSALAKSVQTDVTKLSAYNDQLAKELADFTTYSAQYGKDIADQLVQLEDWYYQQKQIIGNNADALAVLNQVFQDKWKAIIDGVSSGVDGTIDALKKIKEYLDSLSVSDLSPLTPLQKLQESQRQFNEQLTAARSGNVQALQDLPQYADQFLKVARDFYASSQQFTDIYNSVTSALRGLLTSTPTTATTAPTTVTSAASTTAVATTAVPTTPPAGAQQTAVDSAAALVAALPANSTLASSADVTALGAALTAAFNALPTGGVVNSTVNAQAVDNSTTSQTQYNTAVSSYLQQISSYASSQQTTLTSISSSAASTLTEVTSVANSTQHLTDILNSEQTTLASINTAVSSAVTAINSLSNLSQSTSSVANSTSAENTSINSVAQNISAVATYLSSMRTSAVNIDSSVKQQSSVLSNVDTAFTSLMQTFNEYTKAASAQPTAEVSPEVLRRYLTELSAAATVSALSAEQPAATKPAELPPVLPATPARAPAADPLAAALPANGDKLASAGDLKDGLAALAAKLIEAIAALAKSNSADSDNAISELKRSLVAIEEEISAQ